MKEIRAEEAEAFVSTGEKVFVCFADEVIEPDALAVFAKEGIRVLSCGECDSDEEEEDFNDEDEDEEEGSCCGDGCCCGGGGDYAMALKSPDGREYLSEHLDLFYSEEVEKLKYEVCDIGRRLWEREYTDGNGGNISVRVGPNEFLCTPTGVSKGFLSPDMLCMVDGEGLQIAGSWKRTSEITSHLAIFRSTPAAKSVCHAHPVHATAFAVAGVTPPPRLIPEWEVFAGNAVVAPYETPGSKDLADILAPLAPLHQSILMANHGVICWGTSVEDAYFKMEITDAYCRTVFVAMQIPSKRISIPADKLGELLAIKKTLGLPDARHGFNAEQLHEMDPWEFLHDSPLIEKIADAVAKKIADKK